MIITHIVMFKFLTGATEVGAAAILPPQRMIMGVGT